MTCCFILFILFLLALTFVSISLIVFLIQAYSIKKTEKQETIKEAKK